MATATLTSVLQQIRTIAHARAYEETSDRDLLERFLAQREEAAFVALLKRHGPMVMQVCRRIQGNEQDAEDVFQATFLLLAARPTRSTFAISVQLSRASAATSVRSQ